SNPASPTEAGFFDTPGTTFGVALAGSHAYLADGPGGLRIIDVSDPANPAETGSLNSVAVAEDVVVSGNYAYVAGTLGLRVIDIIQPANPLEAGYYDTGETAFGVAVSGDRAYVADGLDGMYIIRNDLVSGVEPAAGAIPDNFRLHQNYPNP
ncbi:MAG: hypothetical protein KDG51_11580, partial [Calditrichaeota bacterium]|nr:hypothetical protein [Calditrichota bacterium]